MATAAAAPEVMIRTQSQVHRIGDRRNTGQKEDKQQPYSFNLTPNRRRRRHKNSYATRLEEYNKIYQQTRQLSATTSFTQVNK